MFWCPARTEFIFWAKMEKIMLVNVVQPEETRVAILEDGVLEELYLERISREQIAGNIYKGRVVNVEPSLQAAFVDFGGDRNGFLHFSDILPSLQTEGSKGSRRRRGGKSGGAPPQPGRELIVKVTKEGIGNKGPTLTTYISLPGRYLVMMPETSQRGISQKITDEEERARLKKLLSQMKLPDGIGFIIRTAGAGRSKSELQRDLNYLKRLWAAISKRAKREKAPALIYRESDLVIRAIRDVFSTDVTSLIIDSESAYKRAVEFFNLVMPKYTKVIKLYQDSEPLFHRYNVEEEIQKAQSRRVQLPSGGSIVIEKTEALVAIDVNSGKFKKEKNIENTAFRTNMEAAPEIARQLRLRDLGGVIINDFIDMRDPKNRRKVEKALSDALRRDRARTKMSRMTQFGIIEMTRQRIRPSVAEAVYEECPYCKGAGAVKTPESMAIDIMRQIKVHLGKTKADRFEVRVNPRVADYLQNEKRREFVQLEEDSGKSIVVKADDSCGVESVQIRDG